MKIAKSLSAGIQRYEELNGDRDSHFAGPGAWQTAGLWTAISINLT